MTATTLPRSAALSDMREEDPAYVRVTWRLIPLLFICYVAAYLDRWHIAIPALVGAGALVASTFVPQTPFWAIVTLTVATMGILTGLAQFWVLPPAFLGGAAAAAGIALITSVGNLAGFVSPFAVGWIKDATGSTNNGLYVIAATLVVGSAIILATTQRGASKSAS